MGTVSGLPVQNYTAVLYTNNQFVAVGTPLTVYSNGNSVPISAGDKVLVSADGRTWASHTITNSPGLLTLNYWKGMYIATGKRGVVATSTNAMDWTISSNAMRGDLRLAAANDEKFMAGDRSLVILITTNGVDWIPHNPTIAGDPDPPCFKFDCEYWAGLSGLAYFNCLFVAHGFTAKSGLGPHHLARTLISTNGINWAEIRQSGARYDIVPNTLLVVNDRLIQKTSTPAATTDLQNWTPVSPQGWQGEIDPFIILGGAFGDSNYVFVGPEMVVRGLDLQNLERVDSPVKSAWLSSIAAHQETIVATSLYGVPAGSPEPPVLIVSTNKGRRFDPVPLPPGSGGLKAVEFAQDKFVAVGTGGTVIRTTNGYQLGRRPLQYISRFE